MGPMTWEAIATFATGMAAVAGATWVGRKQVAVSDRQTRILEQQSKFAEIGLKVQLFENRLAVYDCVFDWAWAVLGESDDSIEESIKFHDAVHRSQFLFSRPVYEGLVEVRDRLVDIRRMRRQKQSLSDELEGETGERLLDLERWLVVRVRELPDLFGDELRLGYDVELNASSATSM